MELFSARGAGSAFALRVERSTECMQKHAKDQMFERSGVQMLKHWMVQIHDRLSVRTFEHSSVRIFGHSKVSYVRARVTRSFPTRACERRQSENSKVRRCMWTKAQTYARLNVRSFERIFWQPSFNDVYVRVVSQHRLSTLT